MLASLAQLKRVFSALPRRSRIMLYNALVLPHLDYCSCVWSACGANSQLRLERVQNYAMRLIMSAKPRAPSAELIRTHTAMQMFWTSLYLLAKTLSNKKLRSRSVSEAGYKIRISIHYCPLTCRLLLRHSVNKQRPFAHPGQPSMASLWTRLVDGRTYPRRP